MAAVGIIKCSKIQSISNKFSHIFPNSHFNSVKMLLRKYALFTEISIQIVAHSELDEAEKKKKLPPKK